MDEFPEKFGVWCIVSGGVTGRREAWVKRDGRRAEFATHEEAAAEAARLTREMNGPYATARFRYTAESLG